MEFSNEIQEEYQNKMIPLEIENEKEEGLYDQIMDKTTFSRNRIFIMICMVFIFISDGMEMTIFSFIIKPFGEYFGFEESDVTVQVAASSLFLGIIFGSALAGFITKKFGRILIINISNFFILISHLLSGLLLYYPVYIICRCIMGLTLGIIIPIFMNIFGEYCPSKYRGFLLMVSWSFYGVGQMITNVIGLFVMPELEKDKLKIFLLILTIFPFLAFISCIFLLKNSPKGLLVSKNIIYNRTSYNMLSEINKEQLNENEEKKVKKELDELEKKKASLTMKETIKEMFNQELKKTTILMIVAFISIGYNAFGIYSISSYFLDYLDKEENGTKEEEQITPAKDIIINQILYGLAEIVADVAGGLFGEIRKLGRKGGIMIFTILASILTIIGLFSKILFEVMSPISSGFTSIYVNLAMDYVVELYPIEIRDSSTSLLFMIYRISCFTCNFISMGFYNINKYVPFIIYAGFAVVISICTWLLPYEMVGKSMK